MTGISRSFSRIPCGASSLSSISACSPGRTAIALPESFTIGCRAFNDISIGKAYEHFMTMTGYIQAMMTLRMVPDDCPSGYGVGHAFDRLPMRIAKSNGEQGSGKHCQLKTSRHQFDLLPDDSSRLTHSPYFCSRRHLHSRRWRRYH